MKQSTFAVSFLSLALFLFPGHLPAEPSYQWNKQGDSLSLARGDEPIGMLVSGTGGGIISTDTIVPLDEGVFRIQRTYVNTLNVRRDGIRLTLDFAEPFKADYAMIPSVMYNGNVWGKGREPKQWQRDGQWWSFSSTRTPIPGATYSQNQQFCVALWGEPDRCRDAFSCQLMPADDATTLRLIWPEEERPLSYSATDRFRDGWAKTLSLAPGETYSVSAILVVAAPKENPIRSMSRFLDVAWSLSKKTNAPVHPPEELWGYRVRYAKESLWAEEPGFKGFSIGLLPAGDGWKQRGGGKYEIGWCGQNASLANSLLTDYLKNNDTNSLEKGLAVLDAWAAGAVLSNGLFAVEYDDILAHHQRFNIDACNLGIAAVNYFEAADLAKKCGAERPNYRGLALGICDFALRAQAASGQFAKAWRNTGECVDRDGTVGAFMVLPLLKAWEITRDPRYLDSAKRGHEFYITEFLQKGFSSAGALDTTCVDKESSMPLLRASIQLYQITHDRRYLQQAEDVSYYLSTWLWHYSTVFPESSELRRQGWDSFGCTSVSTQHNHLDLYALYWVNDWLQLAELTGHAAWKEKALAIWNNGTQMVGDGTLKVLGKLRPVGGQNEAYFDTYWGDGFGQPNNWLVAWPGAFQLETLRHLENWSVLKSDTVKN